MPPLDLPFPLLGKDENWAGHKQPPLTSPGLKNVRPYGTIDNRARGGQRPAQIKDNSVQIAGTADPVMQMVQVTVVNT